MPCLVLIPGSFPSAPESSGRVLSALALILCVAAVTTVLFQRLRQPVVLGYLLAGFLLGPQLFQNLIEARGTLEFLSQLGVILLMYSLGLEFRLRRLRAIGSSAAFIALLEVGLMLWLGFSAARLLGWSAREALFTGGLLAISSTTMIRKVFGEREVDRKTRELVTGVLVFEDLIAIVMLAALTTVATGAQLQTAVVAQAAGRLAIFIAVVLIAGLLFVPRLVTFTVALGRRETLLVAALGVCFAFSLLALRAGYSVALGAFLAGSLVAESGHGERIGKLIEPVHDLFVALFFVSVGMLIDPEPLREHWRAGILLAGLVIGGKLLGVSLGAFLSGKDTRSALRAGLCMAQVGEFSFIIAGLGVASGATRADFIPLAVGVATLTAFVSPLLIAHADRIAGLVERNLPARFAVFARQYSGWVVSIRAQSLDETRWGSVRRTALVVSLDALVVSGLVIAGALGQKTLTGLLVDRTALAPGVVQGVVFLVVALLCVWPLLGMVRGARRLGTQLASLALSESAQGQSDRSAKARPALTAGLQVAVLLAFTLPVLLVTEPFLQGFSALGLSLVLLVMSLSMLRRRSPDLQGHVRAGAQVFVAVLGHISRRAPQPPVEDLASLLPSLGPVLQVRVPAHHTAVGATLSELGLSGVSEVTVLSIVRGQRRYVLPHGSEIVCAGDQLSIAGQPEALVLAIGSLALDPSDAPTRD